MRFSALCDIASRTDAANYEADARYRQTRRQRFMGEEIASLTPIKKMLINADELVEAA